MQKPSYKEAFLFWLKLGFISFGGPAGQISIMHEFLVEKKKWISDAKFLHALNFCMVLPGPEAQQLATYTGWLLHGTRGGLTAGVLFVLPSMVLMLALSWIYVTFGNIPYVQSLFSALKPAVIGIVILALVKIARKSLNTPLHYVIAFLAFVGVFFFHLPFPIIICISALMALGILWFYPTKLTSHSDTKIHSNYPESSYSINSHTTFKGTNFSITRFAKQIIIYSILWCIPLMLLYVFSDDFNFWKELSVFFTKAAFVTFGGAYAVLPYVAQVSVEKYKWLSDLQMIDGLALGETTPGPLVIILSFVGFMAGYNHFNSSVELGIVGLLTTTFYTFLPSFFFIFSGAPIIEKTQQNPAIKKLLSIISAAVVGVVLNLTIYLFLAVIFPSGIGISSINYVAILWTFLSVYVLYYLKFNMVYWILFSAFAGIIYYHLTGLNMV